MNDAQGSERARRRASAAAAARGVRPRAGQCDVVRVSVVTVLLRGEQRRERRLFPLRSAPGVPAGSSSVLFFLVQTSQPRRPDNGRVHLHRKFRLQFDSFRLVSRGYLLLAAM